MRNFIKRKWFAVSWLLALMLVLTIAAPTIPVGKIGQEIITIGHIAEAAGTADYTIDGVADNVQFQQAIDALPATGGRIVCVSTLNIDFNATVTRAIDNVIIEGTGRGCFFANDGITPLFTAGGNNWVFTNIRTDAGDINMGATTGWMWTNVTINATYYAYRSPYGTSAMNDVTVASLTDSGLTNGRVPVAGVGGLLGDDGDFLYDTATNILTAEISRSATLLVAANDASAKSKAQADYVCDAVDDEVQIEAADAVLVALGGGKIQLSEGTFVVGAPADISSNVTLEGFSMFATVIQIEAAASIGTIIRNEGLGSSLDSYIVIRDMTLDGNRGSGADGHGVLLDGVEDCLVENIYTHDIGGTGRGVYIRSTNATRLCKRVFINNILSVDDNESVEIAGDTTNAAIYNEDVHITDVISINPDDRSVILTRTHYSTVKGLRSVDAGETGLYISYDSDDNTCSDIIVENPGIFGIMISQNSGGPRNCARNSVTNFRITGAGSFGIDLLGTDNTLSNGVIDSGQTDGIRVGGGTADADRNIISKVIIYNNGIAIPNNYDGIRVAYGEDCIISNCIIYDSEPVVGNKDQRNGIRLDAATDNFIIENNMLENNRGAGIVNAGTNHQIRDNTDYLTENFGTATLLSGNTTIAVTHGLSATPTTISITWLENPTNPIADWWVDTIGAATFTLNGVDPGASNLDFYWEAKVR